jgi:integrase
MKDLTLKQVLSAPPGRHCVSKSLYLYVSPDRQTRRFMFRYTKPSTGRVTEHGLGSMDEITLAQAHAKRDECRLQVRRGIDPVEHGRVQRLTAQTFASVATQFIEVQARKWRRPDASSNDAKLLLLTHAAGIGHLPITDIGTTNIAGALRPLWLRAPNQARRVIAAILRVISYGKALGLPVANPYEMREAVKHLFPAAKATKNHFTAMDYADIPAFVRQLRKAQDDALSPSVIEFLILTAARENEVCGMQWDEIDFESKVWSVPAVRTKTGREHRVPLADRALALLERRQFTNGSLYVWPNHDGTGPITGGAVYKYLTDTMGIRATIHGFRSSFRDWAGNETNFDRVTCELALAHRAGDATELAYRRGDALDKRRALMEEWADYVAGN